MNTRLSLSGVVAAVALLTAQGCAVTSGQQSVGSYMDDAGITTQVKAKFTEDPTVSSGSISVETLKGTVQLAGFVKSAAEKATAERLARSIKGVVAVRNDLVVQP